MQDTIAVALITALSTLSAAGLAGWITLRLQRQQTAAERTRAREESRRTAYADLLAASTDAWHAIDAMWRLVPPRDTNDTERPEIQAALSALKQLDHALHVAGLHGPSSIDDAAAELYFDAWAEFEAIMHVLRDNIGDSRIAAQLHAPGQGPDHDTRLLKRAAFTGKARKAIKNADD
ncbi:hypothetical protein [Streptomyces cyanogenus]|uniref:Secreted protein n=1 Tax=Streptomyces cyanogenus TaxID=80860 RepID=A0ABX7TY38_STRCY|nr:hypothetical protein [Streptomyces cyanogenus]QTE01203.1 hypothetical protein S1361_27995 [Streptomyces cyanogenus]